MKFEHDFYKHLSPPPFILCKANWDRIGVIKCTNKKAVSKYNDLDEITFTTYRYTDGMLDNTYDHISEMKYVLVPDIGRFTISRVQTVSEGMKYEYKECTAVGIQALLAQKNLDTFTINMGTTESIDGVKLFNPLDPTKSLLNLVLEKFPDWSIGHVSAELMTQERSFEVSVKDVYSFLTTDAATAFECVFVFDTLNMSINVYKESEYGKDTNVSVSYNNLLTQTSITSSIDDIKTCLSLTGYDDLNVREVNMGFDKIYNFEYYNSLDFFSKSLYTSYNSWKTKYDSQLPKYNTLLSQYQKYYEDLYYWEHEKMPDDPESTDWGQYGLVPLQEKLSKYELLESTYMKSGWGEISSTYYNSKYLPNHNTIQSIKSQISSVENQITSIKSQQSNVGQQMNSIIKDVSMETNFTSADLTELSKFIREQDLSTQNYVVTDNMTDSERIDMLNDFLSFGQKELAKISQPQLSFSSDMVNLFAIPEFDSVSMDFTPGNYIYVTLRDDYIIKARLLSVSIDFYDTTNFSVTFGNIAKVKGKNLFIDLTESINQTKNIATSVSFNSSYWNKNSKKADDATKILSEGLIAAGAYLKSGDDSELVMDKRGMFINTTTGTYAGKDSIFVGGGRILFTDDNWMTVSEAIGRVDIHGQSTFGVLAKAMIAGYISASEMEASIIRASEIISTSINNGNGTFSVDKDGHVVGNDITVNAGYIGGENGFTIQAGKMYSGKPTFGSSNAGVYMGTDGVSLGKGNTFSVDKDGYLKTVEGEIAGWKITQSSINNGISFTNTKDSNSTGMGTNGSNWAFWAGNGRFSVDQRGYIVAQSGTIGGAEIAQQYLGSSNGNWRINADGTAAFKNVFITGVQGGSNFGGIEWNGSSTYGNLNGGFWAGSSFGLGGGALSNFNDLVANKVTADYIDAKVQLSAKLAKIGELIATKASITDLDAAKARIGTLEVDVAYVGSVAADNVKSISINAGDIKAINGRIKNLSVGDLKTGSVNGHDVNWGMTTFTQGIEYDRTTVLKPNGETVSVITNVRAINRAAYLLYGG